MSDKNVRWVDSGSLEQRVKVGHDGRGITLPRSGIAESHSGAIVRADTRRARDYGLNETPDRRRAAEPRVQNDCRRRGAGAVEIEPPAADVDQALRVQVWAGVEVFLLSCRRPERQTDHSGDEQEQCERTACQHQMSISNGSPQKENE